MLTSPLSGMLNSFLRFSSFSTFKVSLQTRLELREFAKIMIITGVRGEKSKTNALQMG